MPLHRNCREIANAEQIIMERQAETPQGKAIQLWLAVSHAQVPRWTDEAISRGEFSTVFEQEDALDFHVRLIVRVIRSLQGEG